MKWIKANDQLAFIYAVSQEHFCFILKGSNSVHNQGVVFKKRKVNKDGIFIFWW